MGERITSVSSIMGYPVFTGNLDSLQTLKNAVVNTINQYSYCIAEKDADFKRSLLESDILLPDGIGIVAACTLLTGEKITKVAGADLHLYLLNQLNRSCGKCFYLGSSKQTLNMIQERLTFDFPCIKVDVLSPPYKQEFSDVENARMLSAINAFKPDVLFIGMTAPKQEKWARMHKSLLDVNLICSVGAVFDFYAGTVKRTNKFWIYFGLEWFGRLIKEPKRMWKRYLYYGPVFVFAVCREKWRQVVK